MLLILMLLADSSVMYEFPDGRTVAMISHGDVAMAAESVFITPSGGTFGDFGDSGWLPNMSVRCVFRLVNESSREQHLSVGFPLDARFGEAYTAMDDSMLVDMMGESFAGEYRPPWNEELIVQGLDAADQVPEEMDFRTFVNGREVPVFYRKCALSQEDGLLWMPVAAVWKMTFLPGETVMLENTYNTSWDYVGGGPWREYTMNYILTSGGTWSGPIGEALITLTIPEELPCPTLDDTSSVYWDWSGSPVIDGRTVMWRFSDLEPDENLSFSVLTESRLGHWDYHIDPQDMYYALEWDPKLLPEQAAGYLLEELVWGPVFDARLTARILQALPCVVEGHEPFNGLYTGIFRTGELDDGRILSAVASRRLEAAGLVMEGVENDIQLAEEAGYMEFLPMFSARRSWDEDAVDMYAAMPVKEEKFLDLLEHLEEARSGEHIRDRSIRSFYRLTGWYGNGPELVPPPIPADLVVRYREMVENDGG